VPHGRTPIRRSTAPVFELINATPVVFAIARRDPARNDDRGATRNKVGGNKEAFYNIGTFLRLYPGIDAMATNGLRWGAQAEIRGNFQGQDYVANGTAVNGTSVSRGLTSIKVQNSSSSSGASAPTSAQTLYVRHAFICLANDQIGIFRLGQAGGVSGIFDNSTRKAWSRCSFQRAGFSPARQPCTLAYSDKCEGVAYLLGFLQKRSRIADGFWRMGWDSNPRTLAGWRFSRPLP
jgi:hypothetical protein